MHKMQDQFRFLTICAALLLSSLAAAQSAAMPAKTKTEAAKKPATVQQHSLADTDLKAIKIPPLPVFHPQMPKRVVLGNGMIVFLQEDHELPLIDGTAYIYGGSKSEPADKVGLVSIYGSTWRTGGTKTKTGDQLDDMLEARAARVETGGGLDFTDIAFSCLKGDFDTVLGVVNDLLRNPEFRQDKIELAKNRMRTAIARRNDDLNEIADREAEKIGYGPQSPYARTPEYATVNAVTRQDLLDWRQKYVHPNDIILGITGDFDSAAMEKKLRQIFDSWPAGPAYKPVQVPVTDPKPGMYLVEKDDVNQSAIQMVAPGIRRDNPDYFAVTVMNEIFGGGFSSHLFQELRSREGLAYAVGGGVGAAFDHKALTRLEMGTRSGTTVQAIQGLYREIGVMRTVPVTQVELQRAKDSILNSFIFEFDSKDKIMRERMTYELYGYPADFLERYEKGVKAVTAADVDRVAKKYLVKDKFAALVVGKSADFDKKLDTFGKVTTIDITIPQPPSQVAAPVVSNSGGKELMDKVVRGAGGAEALNAIKTLRVKQTITLTPQGVSLGAEETDVVPDKLHIVIKLPQGEMIVVASPDVRYRKMGALVQELPASQGQEELNNLHRSLWYIAQHAADPEYVFATSGKEKIGDVEASILDVSHGSMQVRWWVDPATGRVLRSQFQANSPSGPATQVVNYSDWQTVDGVTLPFHQEGSANGQATATVKINSLEINPPVDPKLFAKPANSGN